jgi:hypothetical protein
MVVAPARQATKPGGIGSLESILGLLKSLKIRALYSNCLPFFCFYYRNNQVLLLLHIATSTNAVFSQGTGSPGREEDDPVGGEGEGGGEQSCSAIARLLSALTAGTTMCC